MATLRQDRPHRSDGGAPATRPAGPSTTSPQPFAFLSVIVPAKNEAAGLPQLVAEITAALRPLVSRGDNGPHRLDAFEIILVDDGSTDDSAQVLERLTAEYPELRAVRLAANRGQSTATATGFHHARGDWVANLDADLQNDPADLARLWDALPGHDAALGWRVKRRDVWSKRVISKVANRVRNAVLGQAIRDTGCSVRIYPRAVALRLPTFHGFHRFIGPLLLREGCRVVQLPVGHRARGHGQSHYNIWNRSLKVVVDLLGVAWLMRRPVRYEVIEPGTATSRRPFAVSQDTQRVS